MSTAQSAKVEPTVDEIIALLKKSSLPTIIVEGSDDMIVYRRFEERLSHTGVSVLPVGGRLKVLEVFARRNEVPQSLKLAFVADQDTWVNLGVPTSYQHASLVLTAGYSIENDVFVDGNLANLLSQAESTKFSNDVSAFLDWYALALSRHLADQSKPIAHHPDYVLDPALKAGLNQLEKGEQYPVQLRECLQADYPRLLRGKSLLALLVRNTNYKGRQPRHSEKALLESVAVRPGPNLQRLCGALEAFMTE